MSEPVPTLATLAIVGVATIAVAIYDRIRKAPTMNCSRCGTSGDGVISTQGGALCKTCRGEVANPK